MAKNAYTFAKRAKELAKKKKKEEKQQRKTQRGDGDIAADDATAPDETIEQPAGPGPDSGIAPDAAEKPVS